MPYKTLRPETPSFELPRTGSALQVSTRANSEAQLHNKGSCIKNDVKIETDLDDKHISTEQDDAHWWSLE